MKLLRWNCRGILGALTVQSLLDFQRRHEPDAVFLSETHLDEEKAENLRKKMKMDRMIVSPSLDGRRGGLLLLWKKEVRIYSRTASLDFIDVIVEEENDVQWRLTGIYGEPSWDNKHRTYQLLRDLDVQSNLPWTVIGDFNEILFTHEKDGGVPRPQPKMQAFRDALSDCGLEDLGYVGDVFTWFRGGLRERLDRAVANADWSSMHPLAGLCNLEMGKSDHMPLLLDTEYLSGVAEARQTYPRKFEARWLSEETVEEVMKTAWRRAADSSRGTPMAAKLSMVHNDLHKWDRSVLKEPRTRLGMHKKSWKKL